MSWRELQSVLLPGFALSCRVSIFLAGARLRLMRVEGWVVQQPNPQRRPIAPTKTGFRGSPDPWGCGLKQLFDNPLAIVEGCWGL